MPSTKPTSAIVVTTLLTQHIRCNLFLERWNALPQSKELPLSVHVGVIKSNPVLGCFTSHRGAMLSVTEPTLFFEEDAIFAPEFTLDLDYPEDSDLFYFGGEHMVEPVPYADGIVLCKQIRRNHGYVVTDPQAVAKAVGEPRDHIDRALTALNLKTYAVSPFTVGQSAGPSLINIIPRATDMFWNEATWSADYLTEGLVQKRASNRGM